MTAARSSTARSIASRRSSRAARSDWIVGGSSVERLPSASMATICSRKSGLPSAEAAMRSRASAVSGHSTASSSRSCCDSSSVSGSSVSDAPAQCGRASTSSGRPRQSSKMGVALLEAATYSSRSRNVGSAQCRSSRQTTRGRSWASVSSRRRMAQNVSSAGEGSASVPVAPRMRSRISGPSGSAPRAAMIAHSPPAERTRSVSGRKVMPSP